MASRRLQSIIDAELCSGCGLCTSLMSSSGARMRMTERGYLRPEFDRPLTDAEDRRLSEVCPGNILDLHAEGRRMEGEWGPVVELATGHAIDPDIRFKSSSGGAITALCTHLLASGTAEFIVHVGAPHTLPWLNETVISTTREQVLARTGSRYAPSAPLDDIAAHLESGRKFAVVGKPCDIAALRMHARRDPRIDTHVTAMIAFMCGGIPGRKGIELLLEKMKAPHAKIKTFRYRGFGWPGQTTAKMKDGTERRMSYAEAWGDTLSSHVQLRCKICPDGIGMFADIVCGDAWYGDEKGYPQFDEADGRSIVLARTQRGADLLASARTANSIATEPMNVSELAKMQPYQLRRIRLTLSRLLALWLSGRPVPNFRGLHLLHAAFRAGLKANFKSFAGTLRRAWLNRL